MANLTRSIITPVFGITSPFYQKRGIQSRLQVKAWMNWNQCMLLFGDLSERICKTGVSNMVGSNLYYFCVSTGLSVKSEEYQLEALIDYFSR